MKKYFLSLLLVSVSSFALPAQPVAMETLVDCDAYGILVRVERHSYSNGTAENRLVHLQMSNQGDIEIENYSVDSEDLVDGNYSYTSLVESTSEQMTLTVDSTQLISDRYGHAGFPSQFYSPELGKSFNLICTRQ